MEEIVGEIYDERDAVENEIVQIDAHTCIVDGDANLYDLFDIFDYEPQDFDSEYNTVAAGPPSSWIASPRREMNSPLTATPCACWKPTACVWKS